MEEKKEVIEVEQVIVETPKDNKSNYLQIIFLLCLIIAITAMIYATISIWKNKEMLANPLGYNMDKFGLKYCSCLNSDKKIVEIKSISYDNSYDLFVSNYKPITDNWIIK